MNLKNLTVRQIIGPIALLFLIVAFNSCGDSNSYQYPGDGIPYFSKNRSIEDLEQDIGTYAQTLPGAKQEKDKLVFRNINGFKFKSHKAIGKGSFALRAKVKAEKGKCKLEFGSLHFDIRADELLIENKGKVLYSEHISKLEEIEIARASNNTGSVIIFGREGLFKIFDLLEIEEPLIIIIELDDDFSGHIGPWVWVRGRK
ncbi:MAG TPA: hypothetical protein PK747_01275 [Acidobacteriota bacterium]|jgi:hypothetical protein|nr:hypothetical protein [Acidobacteriota bacterium]HNT17972.1 hypothetical protein [Acidobacteriota bacterium]HQO21174.1 hypothetical protein [Acidobacteriota bacterium]HQQ46023.1 hypothetical protein [Acidobacteriota bacterium]